MRRLSFLLPFVFLACRSTASTQNVQVVGEGTAQMQADAAKGTDKEAVEDDLLRMKASLAIQGFDRHVQLWDQWIERASENSELKKEVAFVSLISQGKGMMGLLAAALTQSPGQSLIDSIDPSQDIWAHVDFEFSEQADEKKFLALAGVASAESAEAIERFPLMMQPLGDGQWSTKVADEQLILEQAGNSVWAMSTSESRGLSAWEYPGLGDGRYGVHLDLKELSLPTSQLEDIASWDVTPFLVDDGERASLTGVMNLYWTENQPASLEIKIMGDFSSRSEYSAGFFDAKAPTPEITMLLPKDALAAVSWSSAGQSYDDWKAMVVRGFEEGLEEGFLEGAKEGMKEIENSLGGTELKAIFPFMNQERFAPVLKVFLKRLESEMFAALESQGLASWYEECLPAYGEGGLSSVHANARFEIGGVQIFRVKDESRALQCSRDAFLTLPSHSEKILSIGVDAARKAFAERTVVDFLKEAERGLKEFTHEQNVKGDGSVAESKPGAQKGKDIQREIDEGLSEINKTIRNGVDTFRKQYQYKTRAKKIEGVWADRLRIDMKPLLKKNLEKGAKYLFNRVLSKGRYLEVYIAVKQGYLFWSIGGDAQQRLKAALRRAGKQLKANRNEVVSEGLRKSGEYFPEATILGAFDLHRSVLNLLSIGNKTTPKDRKKITRVLRLLNFGKPPLTLLGGAALRRDHVYLAGSLPVGLSDWLLDPKNASWIGKVKKWQKELSAENEKVED